jgi:hypothetical protein
VHRRRRNSKFVESMECRIERWEVVGEVVEEKLDQPISQVECSLFQSCEMKVAWQLVLEKVRYGSRWLNCSDMKASCDLGSRICDANGLV